MTVTQLRPGHRLATPAADAFSALAAVASFLEDERGFVFVAEEGDAVVGFAYGHLLDRPDGRRAVLLYDVEVDEAHRRRGVATALVASVLQHGALHDAFEVWVLAEPDNAAARRLYQAAAGSSAPQVMYTWELS